MRRIWIVEIQFEDCRIWHATVGAAITRDDARKVLKDWNRRNPCDKFRLVQYQPKGKLGDTK